ncbi:flagellar hook-associated protein FlgL [Paenibacillus radicis (ex Gao et al. 2016)]|uniref:Flagellar hook-associated protein FlgL n=1 Tax=Paenibacillus radicis (ex Gao et al. 2016) TaxID=1737354 RepID=A0A917M8P3_9BACL|nr:flagellar hook-associated protein FlgL [Paenibacillus radicis (ex Gao et al. 2016)]GGG84430.1 flagellar hook-associated protein FlgL [Paenibacillus radicis (ex Gao et al. 2016)]
MSLRVTQGMMHLQLNRNINKNLKVMSDLQNVSSTGMKLNKPSDDPVGITYSLRYRAELSANIQYQKNADQALSWLDFTDTVINQAGDVMQRLKELTTNAANGTNPQEALDAIKSEISQLKTQLIDIGNSKMNGKYIFNGERFDQAPYDDGTIPVRETATDTGSVHYALNANVTVDINLTGNQVFGNADMPAGTNNDNVFSVIDRIMTALTAPADYGAISAELPNIESSSARMLNARAQIGAKVNRIELLQGRLSDFELSLTDLQSKVEDADLEHVLINSKTAQTIYEASLSVGAKVISRSLVDFLN